MAQWMRGLSVHSSLPVQERRERATRIGKNECILIRRTMRRMKYSPVSSEGVARFGTFTLNDISDGSRFSPRQNDRLALRYELNLYSVPQSLLEDGLWWMFHFLCKQELGYYSSWAPHPNSRITSYPNFEMTNKQTLVLWWQATPTIQYCSK